MTATLTLHAQYPARAMQPIIPSLAILTVDGVDTIVGRANTLSQLRSMKPAIYKLAKIKPQDVPAREDTNARRDWQELPALDGEFDVGPAFTVKRRFELMAIAADMVLDGALPSIIIVGQGGLGKSYQTMAKIAEAGYNRVNFETTSPVIGGLDSEDVVYVTGAASPMGLYKVLANHRHQTIVFDDCDAVFKDPDCINMLKNVLDSNDTRRVSWATTTLEKEGWETTIEFTGQVIYISNRNMSDIPQPLQSRSLMIDLTLSEREIFDRMREIAEAGSFGIEGDEIDEVLDCLYKHRRHLKELSLRTLKKAAAFYRNKPDHWRDLVAFTL